jgi:ribosomal protein S13
MRLKAALTTIPGVGRRTAETLLAEVGVDMSQSATLADVGNVAAFVASDQARTMTAATVSVEHHAARATPFAD